MLFWALQTPNVEIRSDDFELAMSFSNHRRSLHRYLQHGKVLFFLPPVCSVFFCQVLVNDYFHPSLSITTILTVQSAHANVIVLVHTDIGEVQGWDTAGSVISGSLSGSATKIGVTLLGAIIPSLREQRAGDILARWPWSERWYRTVCSTFVYALAPLKEDYRAGDVPARWPWSERMMIRWEDSLKKSKKFPIYTLICNFAQFCRVFDDWAS